MDVRRNIYRVGATSNFFAYPLQAADEGASGALPPIKNLCLHFIFGPPVASYIQYYI